MLGYRADCLPVQFQDLKMALFFAVYLLVLVQIVQMPATTVDDILLVHPPLRLLVVP